MEEVSTAALRPAYRHCVVWCSVLTLKDANRLRIGYAILGNVEIRIPNPDSKAEPDDEKHETCVYEKMFNAGIRLPFLPKICKHLSEFGLSPSQIEPNGLCLLISCYILWPLVLGKGAHITTKEFLFLYRPMKYEDLRTFQGGSGKFLAITEKVSNPNPCEPSFFFLSSLG